MTGITVADFDLLVRLKVFNAKHMNQAVFAFRCYEDASLSYSGLESHAGLARYGLYDTVVEKVQWLEQISLANERTKADQMIVRLASSSLAVGNEVTKPHLGGKHVRFDVDGLRVLKSASLSKVWQINHKESNMP